MNLPFPVESAAALIRESETLGMPLLVICLAAYGDEIFGSDTVEAMDPLELYARLEDDFRARLTETGENRIQAMLMAVATDGFYDDPVIFVSVAKALNAGDLGELPDGVLEELTLGEAMWATYEVGMCRDDDIQLSPQVAALVQDAQEQEASEEGGNSHEQYLQDQRIELANQLQRLGVHLPHAHVNSLA